MEQVKVVTSEMRICRWCGTGKSIGEFPLVRGKLFRKCKACTVKQQQVWVGAHRDRVAAHKAAYEASHPQEAKQSRRVWYERNRETALKNSQVRKAERREETKARYRAQYAEDPTPFIVRAKRREARDVAVGGVFTVADKCALFEAQQGICANPYCQTDLSVTGFHADHKTPVMLGGSHNPDNRQLLCPTCNHRKGAMTNEEWLRRREEVELTA